LGEKDDLAARTGIHERTRGEPTVQPRGGGDAVVDFLNRGTHQCAAANFVFDQAFLVIMDINRKAAAESHKHVSPVP
jgi:hypothetical protein